MNDMPNPIVFIPPVDREIRIGSVFNDIFSIIYQTEQTDTSNGRYIEWDFSRCDFLHPFYLGILSILKKQYGDSVKITNVKPTIKHYLEIIYFHEPLEILPDDNDSSIWCRYEAKSYLPICRFNPYNNSSTKAQELVQNAIRRQQNLNKGAYEVLSLLLAELVDNITEHSHSKDGYLFCQYRQSEKTLNVLICDTGQSIFSSYALNEHFSDSVTNLESSALLLALKGISTKDLPNAENRGHGISKSINLIVKGVGGEFLILSGAAFARYDKHGETIVDLPGDLRWNGTAILLKIPVGISRDFNVYDYIY